MKIEIEKEDYEFLKWLKNEIETQDNHGTADPIFAVRTKREKVVEHDNGEGRFALYNDEEVYETCEDLISYIEDCLELEDKDFTGYSFEELRKFIEMYRGKELGECYIETYYEPVAYFLTRAEAFRYTEYQSHNLRSPQVYAYAMGYANRSDFFKLRKALQNMKFED